MQHFLPTIYSVSDPHPIAVCSAPLPIHSEQESISKERGYTNSCTMKVMPQASPINFFSLMVNSSMGLLEVQVLSSTAITRLGLMTFVHMSGKSLIQPSCSTRDKSSVRMPGLRNRLIISVCLWRFCSTEGTKSTLGFTEGLLSPRYVPADISQPAFRLNGIVAYITSADVADSIQRA